jgi:hypothetical protein
MGKGITDRDKAIVQQIILDGWNPLRLNKKIASHFGLTINQVRHIRGRSAFQTEYKRQLAIYQGSFDDIRLADRKERVKAMQDLAQLVEHPICYQEVLVKNGDNSSSIIEIMP